jgi:hypothetical protein
MTQGSPGLGLAAPAWHGSDMLEQIKPTYRVVTRRCSLNEDRDRWLLLSSDRAHKIHAPDSYKTEAEAQRLGEIEASFLNEQDCSAFS